MQSRSPFDLIDERKWEEAISLSESLIASNPDEPLYHVGLGQACAGAGYSERAERELKTAVELSPKEESVSLALYVFYARSEKYEDAIVEVRRFQAVSFSEHYAELDL